MKSSQLKKGVILSYINLLIGSVIPLIYTPIMLRLLGKAEYGVYNIAQSIIGYLGLLNFGIGGSIIRYLAKCRAEANLEEERRTAGLFIKIYTCIAILVLAAGFLCAANVQLYGKSLSAEEIGKLRVLVILMTIRAAVFLPASVFASIVLAHEKYIFDRLIGITITIITPIINLPILYLGFGSVGLVIASTVLSIFMYGGYICYVLKRIGFYPSFKKSRKGLLQEIIHYSFYVFLANIVDILFWSTDRLIIGWAVGATAVTIYGIGATFNTYITNVSTAISGVILPRMTEMVVKDSTKEEYTSVFIKIGRVQFIMVSFLVSAFIVFGRQFIAIWAGEGYENSYYVALLTMIPLSIPLIENTGITILYAMNKHKFRSIVYFIIAVINVVLTFCWVGRYGIIGAAAATCFAYILGQGFVMNWFYYKNIGINIPLFWFNILKMSPVMIIMGAASWFVLNYISVASWGAFLIAAVLYTLVYFALAYKFMFNDYEKGLLTASLAKISGILRKNDNQGA